MFLTKVSWNERPRDNRLFPFDNPVFQSFDHLDFTQPITFLIGENGSGKSTFLEGIALACNMNPEGGSTTTRFHTTDSHTDLDDYLTLTFQKTPPAKFFLRAETFYNVGGYINQQIMNGNFEEYQKFGGSLLGLSHGESFLKVMTHNFQEPGFYLLDEPEAALSLRSQECLLILLNSLTKAGSQFIIVTHSPILLASPNATIINIENNWQRISYKETELYKQYHLFINNPELMVHNLLKETEEPML